MSISTQLLEINHKIAAKLGVRHFLWIKTTLIKKLTIVEFQQTPSVEFNGNFTLLGVWKMEFQCKYAANQHSQMNFSKILKS
jgi:hypothetical protein